MMIRVGILSDVTDAWDVVCMDDQLYAMAMGLCDD